MRNIHKISYKSRENDGKKILHGLALLLCIGILASFKWLRPAFFEFLALFTCRSFTIAMTMVHVNAFRRCALVCPAPFASFSSLHTRRLRLTFCGLAENCGENLRSTYPSGLIKPFLRARFRKSRILYFNERDIARLIRTERFARTGRIISRERKITKVNCQTYNSPLIEQHPLAEISSWQ